MFFRFLHFWYSRRSTLGGSTQVNFASIELYMIFFRNRCVINLPKTISENQSALFQDIKLTRWECPVELVVFPPPAPDCFFPMHRSTYYFPVSRYYIPEDTSMEYICSQSDANGLHTCGNLPPYTVNGIKCNLTIDEYEYVSNDSCINWNVYYNECQVGHFQ